MFVDSHCHINFPNLISKLPVIFKNMERNKVSHAMCVSVNLKDFPEVLKIAETFHNIYASVGVHPDYENVKEPSVAELVRLSANSKIIAIGETGLDYHRLKGDLDWQRERFRVHIRASRITRKPLIIHTRSASLDTLKIIDEEKASTKDGGVAGVMHCFTETLDFAYAALEMGFYISFSGIVTFKNAKDLQNVAKKIPLERMLIETDSPYLAPVPYRGKINEPSYVPYVANFLAELKGISVEEIASVTKNNFFKLFNLTKEGNLIDQSIN
tara:strand:+ start:655 stop:1464 length:810 start_codon:yes stop_codon:yes gene_type:complete